MAEAEGGLEGGPLGRASEGPTGSGGEGAQAVTFADKVGDTDSERGGKISVGGEVASVWCDVSNGHYKLFLEI